jgi:hypothetical protein
MRTYASLPRVWPAAELGEKIDCMGIASKVLPCSIPQFACMEWTCERLAITLRKGPASAQAIPFPLWLNFLSSDKPFKMNGLR